MTFFKRRADIREGSSRGHGVNKNIRSQLAGQGFSQSGNAAFGSGIVRQFSCALAGQIGGYVNDLARFLR